MVMLSETLQRAESQRLSYRASAVSAMQSGGGSGGGIYGTAAAANTDWSQEASGAARMYSWASRGHAYTAIRPIAVRIADQAVRVGEVKPAGSDLMKRMVEKAYCGDEELRFRDHSAMSLLKSFSPAFVKQQAKNVDPIEDHPLLPVLADPNPYMTGWALMYCTAFSIEAIGEAIWIMDNVRQADGKSQFVIYYVPRSWVEPMKTDDGNPFGEYKWCMPNVWEDLPPIPGKNVCHFMKPNPANPLVSHCGTQAQALALAGDEEIQKAQFHLTRNLSRPGMLVIMGDLDKNPVTGETRRPELTVDQRQQVAAQVKMHYTSAARFGDPLILDALIQDVRPYMPMPVDVDYSEGSKLTKSRIFEGYGTNPLVAGQIEDGNRAQAYVAHDTLNFLQVNPLASLMSETMTKRIGPLFTEGAGGDSGRLLIWIDQAMAKDPDLMNTRFAAVSTLPGVLTKGDARKFLATGEYEYVPQDDDDEPTGPEKPAPAPAQPGGAFAGGAASLNPYSLRTMSISTGPSGAMVVGRGDGPGDGKSTDTVPDRVAQWLVLGRDHHLAVAVRCGQVVVGAEFVAMLDAGTWTRVPGGQPGLATGGSEPPTLKSGSGDLAVLLERDCPLGVASESVVLAGGDVPVRLVAVSDKQ